MNGKRAKKIRKYARSVNASKSRYRKIKENWQRGTQGQNPVFEATRERSPSAGEHVRVLIAGELVVSSLGVGRNPRRIWREGEPVHVLRPVRAAKKAKLSPVLRAKLEAKALR